MNTRTENDIAKEILSLKKKIYVTSSELEYFLQYLDQTVFKRGFSFCGISKCSETPEFMRAFGTLTALEKGDYYLCCLKIVHELNKNEDISSENLEKQQFQVSYRLNKSKEWVSTVITLDPSANTLYFNSTSESIKLQNYLIRYSKCKDRNAFALECSVGKSFYETIRISHSNYVVFEDLQLKVKNMVVAGLKEKILSMMNIYKRSNELSTKSKPSKKQSLSIAVIKGKQRKSLRQLIQQSTANLNFTIEDYNAISGTLVDEKIVANLDNFSSYEEVGKDIFVHTHLNRVKKVYYFNEASISKNWLIDQLNRYDNFKVWKSSLFMISLLAQIPSEKTHIFHEIDMYKDSTECDYVYLRHFFTRGDKAYFIDKSISTVQYGSHQTSKSRGNIEYCIWRIQSSSNNKIQVLIECELTHVDCTDIYEIISEQIGELEKIVLCKSHNGFGREQICSSMEFQNNELEAISSFNDNKEFTSYEGISEESHSEEDESGFYSIYSQEKQPESSLNDEVVWEFQDKKFTKPSINKYRYKLVPDNNPQKVYKKFKNNQFFDDSECIVNDHGDLLFVNQQKVKAQSNVLKNVLKKIGSNIFSGKSILNISLPIEIFASDTNLERLCKANAYAPLFLENKISAPPLQRMKAVIGYSLGNVLLYINMAKPFNPVIGETFQGFIDGCPLYGEQTSHHPPISTIFMIGRGYFIQANLQAKIEFGINSVSGINDGLYKVAFHNSNPCQNIISYFGPPGELSGVIYGDRKLSLNNKTRYFDQKNQIFCEISWGRNKKQAESNFTDYMEGNIVSLHKYQGDIHKVKPSKQDQVLGTISGRWTQKIYFNQEVIFDVNTLHPYEVIEETKPLQSDGKFRRDRMLMETRRLAEAQEAKEQIEQIQRRDRKLRKQYGK